MTARFVRVAPATLAIHFLDQDFDDSLPDPDIRDRIGPAEGTSARLPAIA